MPKPTRLDLRRLERDVSDAPLRSGGHAPGGRPATGLMAVVRDNLEALVAMQAGGVTWKAIAAGLTKQGYTTGDGRPLTGAQISGLVSSVRRQAKRRAAKMGARQTRSDLPVDPSPRRTERRLALSADLASLASPLDRTTSDAGRTEDAIRRENLDKLRDILKKD
ncbi:hypothetical protein [Methylorubrum sp. SL192]|uniref:hypothetical protein n=1 Tax=Methylorubrum sp. SL192 TaxID=2995167 RepID=UPI0022759A6D|nr:hypothetical protein [Methylorubrum sp. SL192]MCY1644082.1 hypothetical protein [Methylorubrum sp. SL192]